MRFLVHQHLSVPAALAELKKLSSSQIRVLLDLYRDGLHGFDLRSLVQPRIENACAVYDKYKSGHKNLGFFHDRDCRNTAKYFINFYRKRMRDGRSSRDALAIAANELEVIDKNKYVENSGYSRTLRFLRRNHPEGMRACDLHEYVKS